MGCSNTTILAFLDASFIPVKKKKKKLCIDAIASITSS